MLGLSLSAVAQEFNARVSLNKSQIQNASLDYLDDLVPLIENYINNFNWTELTFEENERIRLNMQIILTSETNANFDATLVITVERPIYNTLTTSPLVVFSDNNWRFNFNRNRSLTHDVFQFDDIASMIDFYMYLILGYDFDSFSELGGTEYLRRAQNILEIAQSAGAFGWTSGTGTRRNRYFLISTLINPASENYRKAIYQYHRRGLDIFTQNPDAARTNVASALRLIQEARRQTTEDYLFDIFFSTKSREITSIFIDSEASQRLDIYLLLTELDASRMSEYERLQ